MSNLIATYEKTFEIPEYGIKARVQYKAWDDGTNGGYRITEKNLENGYCRAYSFGSLDGLSKTWDNIREGA